MKMRVANMVSRALRASAAASRRSLHSEGRTLVPAFMIKGGAAASSQITRAAAEAQDSSARGWFPAAFFLSAAAVVAQDQNLEAAEVERTFIAIKPDGVQRGLISKIIGRFERKGYKLVGIKLVTPSKEFAERHYDDLKGRPFFNGLTDFLSSGPVVAMVWEGQGVIKYGRKLIGQTSPQASEPGTIRGDYAIVVGRNIIHGSDGPETAEAEIKLWFSPEELNDYNLVSEKWLYE